MRDATMQRYLCACAAAALLTAGCFEEDPYVFNPAPADSSEHASSEGAQAITPDSDDDDDASDRDTDGDAGDASDAASGDPDVPSSRCGDGVVDASEECDDGDEEPGDGCSADCRIETTGCAGHAEALADDVIGGMAVCADPTQTTCEEDFATLCAPGWHLCSAREHQARNDGWNVDLGGRQALGTIRCRANGGAGHYSVSTMHADGAENCQVGTSRPECPSAFGCNETFDYALCCAKISTCGNGVTDAPYEECDDGNAFEGDGCSSACSSTVGSGPYC